MEYDFDKVIDRTGTNCSKWDLRKEVFGRDDVLPMWVADTDFEAPKEVIEAMEERLKHGIYGYTYRPKSFNKSIINWMKKRHGWDIEDEWITFSPGVVPALSVAINTFTHPGDRVIIQTPIYPPFQSIVKENGRIIVDNELMLIDGRYQMDIEKLEEQIKISDSSFTSNTINENREFDQRIKLLLFCSPHNPTGRVWTKEELLKIGEICLENDILIVSDEIHSDIIYKGYKHIPIASLSKDLEQNTITCIAPSKTFSLAGLSSSAVIIPNKKIRDLFNNTLNKLAIGGGNIFGNIALEAAYSYGEDWLEELLIYLEENLNYLMKYFEEKIPEIKPIKPEATYLVWLDCKELGLEGKELVDFFVNEAKVGVNPGFTFGENGSSFVRLNIGCPRSILEEGLNRIEKAVKRLNK
ncbi:cystathionine beta-lyase [Keratinibaculum paraultunense]|uniref:cysteine-S-conjugate beta-lyase n=1 Tax=Keratinibaculum paraultunense TaxID=1278232 RepID=A0A4V2UUN9_9FIRM|nr:MalY/PatB family protein [Keratinibaculum paraultunense]TCS91690.1 cystathionine beta-lyase [Keratinibaculum paraultunense]